jgi:hypothetical protein
MQHTLPTGTNFSNQTDDGLMIITIHLDWVFMLPLLQPEMTFL